MRKDDAQCGEQPDRHPYPCHQSTAHTPEVATIRLARKPHPRQYRDQRRLQRAAHRPAVKERLELVGDGEGSDRVTRTEYQAANCSRTSPSTRLITLPSIRIAAETAMRHPI